jgi:hypothetical protein
LSTPGQSSPGKKPKGDEKMDVEIKKNIDLDEMGIHPSQKILQQYAARYAEFFKNAIEAELKDLEQEFEIKIFPSFDITIDGEPVPEIETLQVYEDGEEADLETKISERVEEMIGSHKIWDDFMDSFPDEIDAE